MRAGALRGLRPPGGSVCEARRAGPTGPTERRHGNEGRTAPARGASGSDNTGRDARDCAMAREAVGRPAEETFSLWKREQARLKARVVDRDTEAWQRDPAFSGLQRVGGVDVSFVKGDSVSACASLVVLSYPELEVVYEDCRMVSLTAPYVSGFLAFREVPFLVDAVRRLREKEPCLMPQVLLVDGNGVLHHRGFGVACHLGVLTDLPCVGVAKKLLQVDGLENNAQHKEKIQLLQARGDSFPLMGGSGTILGMADIRSRDYIRRTLGVPGPPAPGRERNQKAQRPKACRKEGSEEPAGEGRPPEAHSAGPRTHQKAPDPVAQEQ
ncbi:endonuclease V isoform X7 [Equus przewalskii]|uniref:Endonuclease V isoform X7 n=1 Tax=Equus przewalskii TaxID=9798 RepID=A0ABM4JIS5_EQUPR